MIQYPSSADDEMEKRDWLILHEENLRSNMKD